MGFLNDTSGFTIEGGNFTEVHGNSSTIIYNVHFATGANNASSQLVDDKKWKELVGNVEKIVAKRQEGEFSDEEETSAEEQPLITKRLSIYTNVDIAKKKLKMTVEIIFTLTPAGSPPSGVWPTIVWKTLRFQPNNTIRHDICWYNKAGFCVLEEQNDATLKPGDMYAIVESKHLAILQDIDESPDFSSHTEIPLETTDIAVVNKLSSGQRFALCTIDPSRTETDQFLPVIDIGSMSSNDIFMSGLPVMLQAYIVRGFTERKPIDTSSLLRPLFVDSAGKPNPLDIRTMRSPSAFRLYSNQAGKIILEKD